MELILEAGALVLFQGDSITDGGRNRALGSDLGQGYVAQVAARLAQTYPERRLRWLNRGISGDRAHDLRARWRRDCIDLRPDWVSIMVGINNTWRRYDRGDPTSTEAFADDYRAILQQTSDQLGARLILMEPFLLPISAEVQSWRIDLDPKRAVVQALATEFGAIFIPLDTLFAAACAQQPPAFWASDGVHPSPAGITFIADAWLAAIGA